MAVPVGKGLEAQAPGPLRGQVLRLPDSTALAGQRVVLHRVTPGGGAPVDSTETGPDGRFVLELPPADSQVVFLATTRYDGVLYFGGAIHGGTDPDRYTVTVYPSRTLEPGESLRLRARTVVMTRDGGQLQVMDLVDVEGEAGRTLAGPGGAPDGPVPAPTDPPGAGPEGPAEGARGLSPDEPWWSISLPPGARDPGVLPGGAEPDAIRYEDGEARVSAVIPPPGRRVALRYRIGGEGPVEYRPRRPVGRFELLVRNPEGRTVEVQGLRPMGSVSTAEGPVERFRGRDLGPGDTVRVRIGAGAGAPTAAWVLLGVGGVLAGGAAWLWRRRRGARTHRGGTGPRGS